MSEHTPLPALLQELVGRIMTFENMTYDLGRAHGAAQDNVALSALERRDEAKRSLYEYIDGALRETIERDATHSVRPGRCHRHEDGEHRCGRAGHPDHTDGLSSLTHGCRCWCGAWL